MLFREALLPLVVQVALIFGLLFWMGGARVGAIRRREVRMADIAITQSNWPPGIQQIANCYGNQFQLPVLYLVLTALVMILRKADIVFVVLAWVFVLSRVVHAAIHTTGNDVQLRFYAFLFGAVVLLMMWIIFAAQALIGV
jgi:hypothetical protein